MMTKIIFNALLLVYSVCPIYQLKIHCINEHEFASKSQSTISFNLIDVPFNVMQIFLVDNIERENSVVPLVEIFKDSSLVADINMQSDISKVIVTEDEEIFIMPKSYWNSHQKFYLSFYLKKVNNKLYTCPKIQEILKEYEWSYFNTSKLEIFSHLKYFTMNHWNETVMEVKYNPTILDELYGHGIKIIAISKLSSFKNYLLFCKHEHIDEITFVLYNKNKMSVYNECGHLWIQKFNKSVKYLYFRIKYHLQSNLKIIDINTNHSNCFKNESLLYFRFVSSIQISFRTYCVSNNGIEVKYEDAITTERQLYIDNHLMYQYDLFLVHKSGANSNNFLVLKHIVHDHIEYMRRDLTSCNDGELLKIHQDLIRIVKTSTFNELTINLNTFIPIYPQTNISLHLNHLKYNVTCDVDRFCSDSEIMKCTYTSSNIIKCRFSNLNFVKSYIYIYIYEQNFERIIKAYIPLTKAINIINYFQSRSLEIVKNTISIETIGAINSVTELKIKFINLSNLTYLFRCRKSHKNECVIDSIQEKEIIKIIQGIFKDFKMYVLYNSILVTDYTKMIVRSKNKFPFYYSVEENLEIPIFGFEIRISSNKYYSHSIFYGRYHERSCIYCKPDDSRDPVHKKCQNMSEYRIRCLSFARRNKVNQRIKCSFMKS